MTKRSRTKEREKKKNRRRNPDYREREQVRDNEHHRVKRTDADYHQNEKLRHTQQQRVKRTDDGYREEEQVRNTEHHRVKRTDADYHQNEKLRHTQQQRVKRTDDGYREEEQVRNTDHHRVKRTDDGYREEEQVRNTEHHRVKRTDNGYREREQERNTVSHQKKRKSIPWNELVREYELNIRYGPTHVCNSCGGLWFRSSIATFGLQDLVVKVGHELVGKAIHLDACQQRITLCMTCRRDLLNGLIPRLCLYNGLEFPEIPEELCGLTQLEERLVSPRIPFMQIRPLSYVDKQYGLKGSVVNVMVNVDSSVSILPRSFDETHTVQLKLKRMMRHTSDYMYEVIRPQKVYLAAKYLVAQELYRNEEVTLSVDWSTEHRLENESFIVDEADKVSEQQEEKDAYVDEPKATISATGQQQQPWDETEADEPLNPNSMETLLIDGSFAQGIVFAPGEGQKPISLLTDKHVEELSFPAIYCGKTRNIRPGVKISYADIVKAELRNRDRRCCSISKIFFMFKKRQINMLKQAVSLYLRIGKCEPNLTAGKMLDAGFVESLITKDSAFKVLCGDRSSPSYWQNKMKQLMAMIRQIGIPTFFLTLSAAETKWNELLVILMKVVYNRDITEAEAEALSYAEKCDLIRKDPVTCARYYDKRVRFLFKILQSENGPFGEFIITDLYIRIEFQQRGSPHVHALLWLNGAPMFVTGDQLSKQSCEQFIDAFITCGKDSNDIELEPLVKYQTHKHSKSCGRMCNGEMTCRFGIPHFPMPMTCILEPLEEDLPKKVVTKAKQHLESIRIAVRELDRDAIGGTIHLTFSEFLDSLRLTQAEYLSAIRSTLKRPQVFLKREPNAIRINAYNEQILRLHRANMDLQFILDPYACVQYVLMYINKLDRGLSVLLKKAVDEAKGGNVSHQQRLYKIVNTFLNSSEVSAQEAVYHLLSMPMSRCSRGCVFVNTCEPDERIRLAKSQKDLSGLDTDSDEVMMPGLLDYYVHRPEQLEGLCLADFAAKYNYSKHKKGKQQLENNGELDHVNDDESEESDSGNQHPWIKLNNGYGWVQLRKVPKIIRYRRYSLEQDSLNYYRELVMLFTHWRNETTELIDCDIQLRYEEQLEQIGDLSAQYIANKDVDLQEMKDKVYQDNNESPDNILESPDNEYAVYSAGNSKSDIEAEMNALSINKNRADLFLAPKMIKDQSYFELVRSLNNGQRRYLLNLMYRVKQNNNDGVKVIHDLVTGSAGTGKSVLIKAVHQSLLRYLNAKVGSQPDNVKVLLCASTGKAAYNIGGMTLHSALALSVSQNSHTMKDLSADVANTIRSRLGELKFIIIDEISMVGAKMIARVDARLKQIFHSREPYGGVNMLFFGDFNQLPPVMDKYIFESNSSNPYSYLAGSPLWQQVKLYELTQIMRQKDDLTFAIALNNLGTGQLTEVDIALFKSRCIANLDGLVPEDAIRLFRTNYMVDTYNEQKIRSSGNVGVKSMACDKAFGDASQVVKKRAEDIVAAMKTSDTYGLPRELTLKIDIRYMVTVNVDVEDGLVNGSAGILRHIETLTDVNGIEKPFRVWIDFGDENVGSSARQRFNGIMRSKQIPTMLTPIECVTRAIATKNQKFIMVHRKQFPLVPAEGITGYKAQGQSYDIVYVGATKGMSRKYLYVAMSRARKAAGLYIEGDFNDPGPVKEGDIVANEVRRLKENSRLDLQLRFLEDYREETGFRLMFQNLPYLDKHAIDVQEDPSFMAADVLMFVETRTQQMDISGYKMMAQIKYSLARPFGCVFLGKANSNLTSTTVVNRVMTFEKAHLEILGVVLNNGFGILLVYKSPLFKDDQLFAELGKSIGDMSNVAEKVCIVGDFNIDVRRNEAHVFLQFMASNGYSLATTRGDWSTDGNTQIDAMFSNFPIPICFYYESVLSYHKAISAILSR
jgi:PIF1-like helicase/Helitron helicase-like domain at N-terminus/UvrD-like helicase C-terminal domain